MTKPIPFIERVIAHNPCWTREGIESVLASDQTVEAALLEMPRRDLGWLIEKTMGPKAQRKIMAILEDTCCVPCGLINSPAPDEATVRRAVRAAIKLYGLTPDTLCSELY